MIIKHDLSIGFICNQKNGAGILPRGSCQQSAQFCQFILGIYLPGWIIGTVNDNGLGSFGNCIFNCTKVEVKYSIRGNDFADAPVIVHIKLIFHKERGQNKHLVTWIQQGLQCNVQPSRRPAGHKHLVGRKRYALLG